jgi:cation diffusion facilitator family transporter
VRTEAQKLGYVEGWLSVGLNTGLFALKFWVGVLTGSIAMVADAWHTLSDSLTSLVLLCGFWIAARKPDKEHPFGHGRAEVIAAIVIGTLLAVVGMKFMEESIGRLRHYRGAAFSLTATIIFLVSVFLKEGLARFSIWAGRQTGSHSLLADGWHHRSDAIASALIVVGALAGRNPRLWWIDGVMGIGVSLLILYATYEILKGAADILLGEAPDETVQQQIAGIVRRVAPEARGTHHFHLHRYGAHIEVTFHLRLPADVSLVDAHQLVNQIEQALREHNCLLVPEMVLSENSVRAQIRIVPRGQL